VTAIEWTDATWNPTTGCDRVSPGCANCYALTLAARLKAMGQPRYQRDGDPRTSGPGFGLTLHEDKLTEPLRWRKPRMVFVNSMSDLFHEDVPFDFLDRVFGVMAAAPQHTFQVLTKRPHRAQEYLSRVVTVAMPTKASALVRAKSPEGYVEWVGRTPHWPLPNVWIGTSIENSRFNWRADVLRATPAAVRFISAEPLLGSLFKITKRQRNPLDLTDIDWLIAGGESGDGHRRIDPEWVRELRDACHNYDTAFFFKQWGGRTPKSGGRLLDGREWSEYPPLVTELVA